MIRELTGTVVRGHRVASGVAPDSPYRAGTIELQIPHFARLGLDLSMFYPATINVDIRPFRYQILDAATCLNRVRWCDEHPPETFSFSRCLLVYDETEFAAMIYYPHSETKKTHYHDDQTLEILAPYVEGLQYGSNVAVFVGDDVTLS